MWRIRSSARATRRDRHCELLASASRAHTKVKLRVAIALASWTFSAARTRNGHGIAHCRAAFPRIYVCTLARLLAVSIFAVMCCTYCNCQVDRLHIVLPCCAVRLGATPHTQLNPQLHAHTCGFRLSSRLLCPQMADDVTLASC